MQFKNLSAFASLFAVASKSNYARSITFFLFLVNNDLILQTLFQYIYLVNLTQPKYFFGFNEALERFSIMFIK